MDPQYISIKNFMSHKCTEIDCTRFASALIMGQDHSDPRVSNGVGKTAIFGAIEYALFGTHPTSVLDGIVRDGTDLCQVTFDFELDGSVYRVCRERRRGKSSDVNLFVRLSDGTWASQSQRTATETHNEIQKLIKINANVFRNSVLFSQNDLDGLASAKSSEDRKSILKDALNLNDYKKFEQLAKEATSTLSKEIISCRAVIDSIGDPSADIEELEGKFDAARAKVVDIEAQRDQVQISLNSKKAELADRQRCVSSEMSDAEEKLIDVRSKKKRAEQKIKAHKATQAENEQKLKTLNIKLEKKQSELKALQESCDDLRNKKVRPVTKVKNTLDEVAQNELNGKAYIGSLEAKANELRKPIPDGDECPSCHQEVTSTYRTACEKDKKKKLQELEADIADKRNHLKKVTNRKNRLKKEYDEINKMFTQISSLEGSISAKKSEISNDEDYIVRIKKLNDQTAADLSVQEKLLEELKSRETTLKEMAKSISDDNVNLKIIEIQNDITTYEQALRRLMQEASDANTQVGIFKAKIESKTEDLERLQNDEKRLVQLEADHALHKQVRKAFSSGGIPTMVIHTILDDLQIEANSLLAELKPGHELQFTPDLEISFRIHGRDKEYKQLSGGQKMIMAFSLKIGLSLVIQNRLGVNIRFLGLDEVDQSLDKSAIDHYAEIIRKLQDRFKVFVITHNDSLKDKFSNVILVEGDGIHGATSCLITY
ncbi:MAG: AAA family ATPase [Candidatus Hermodarchaeia archaeon]